MSVLVDANLALLLVVGSTNVGYIERHKRLSGYDVGDFELLQSIVSCYDRLIVTPNILTETSNLLRQHGEPRRSEMMVMFGAMISSFHEEYVVSAQAAVHPVFARLGLSDAIILGLATRRFDIMTSDLDLYIAATKAGLRAINFAHVRENAANI